MGVREAGVARVASLLPALPPDTWRSSQGGAENRRGTSPGQVARPAFDLSKAPRSMARKAPEARTGAGPPEPSEETLTVRREVAAAGSTAARGRGQEGQCGDSLEARSRGARAGLGPDV